MNRQDALKVLGFEPMSTPSERDIKKAFKKKALKYHPDRNSSEDAEAKFKEFNAAQNVLLNPQEGEVPIQQATTWGDIFSNFTNPFFSKRNRRPGPPQSAPIEICKKISLTFEESVLGCNKDIEVDRFDRCEECEGMGEFEVHDPCNTCNGKGGSSERRGNIVFQVACTACQGTGKSYSTCTPCAGAGGKAVKTKLSVKIPGGTQSEQIVRLRNAGNHILGTHPPIRGPVSIIIDVIPDKEMTLSGKDVISTIEISLYEALKGTTKEVNTVKGEAMLLIKAGSRNKEEATLMGYGAEGKGDHRFILDVKYPDDVQKIIDVLEDKEQ